jgi:predicted MFS family arabinose efflux permease
MLQTGAKPKDSTKTNTTGSKGPGLPPALNVVALATFSAALSGRALDPVLPHVADDFGITIATAASFAAVFAFTFAVIQPLIGAAADLFGKARLMIFCLVILGISNLVGSLSTSFPLLFASRILAGIGAGGVFPVALGLASDLVSSEKRQVGISRTLAGSMTGNLLGASFSGLIGDLAGWRGVLAILGVLVVLAAVAVAAGFRGAQLNNPARASLAALRHGYRTIFRNPNARVCYSTVFVEGCCVLGLFPFIASFLFDLGETSLSVAGIVIAGFAIGGLFYTATLSRFLPRLGMKGMMIAGATLVGIQLIATAFGPSWKLQFLCMLMMGWGFYMIHGCIQVFASELSVEARATALSLHSFFFFMGQTVGPIAYGFGLQHGGKTVTLFTAATCMVVLGLVCSRLLRERRPGDAAARPDVEA